MFKPIVACLLALPLAACRPGGGDANAAGAAREATRIAAHTTMVLVMRDSLSSRVNKPGELVRASVATDVTDDHGRVIVASGTPVALRIVKLEPGSDQVRPEGRLELVAVGIAPGGRDMPLHATVGPIPHRMKGRGITRDEAGRIAAGTAVGALVGQALGHDTRSTVIGGAVGAVAGGAVAVRYAYRDVVVDPGARFTITLTQPLAIAH